MSETTQSNSDSATVTTPALADKPAAKAPLVGMDLVIRLRALTCPTCNIAFALPAEVHLQRVQTATAITCPSGHASLYPNPAEADRANFAVEHALLLAELQNAQLQLARVEARAALPVTPAGPPSPEEIKRRAKALAATARNGGTLCPYCGSSSNRRYNLFRHLLRRHSDRLNEALPLTN